MVRKACSCVKHHEFRYKGEGDKAQLADNVLPCDRSVASLLEATCNN